MLSPVYFIGVELQVNISRIYYNELSVFPFGWQDCWQDSTIQNTSLIRHTLITCCFIRLSRYCALYLCCISNRFSEETSVNVIQFTPNTVKLQ